MNCLYPSLDSCDPGVACLDEEARRKSRSGYFWRQDGMLGKSSCGNLGKSNSFATKDTRDSIRSIPKNSSYTTKATVDEDAEKSYCSSKYRHNTVFESETETTYPSTVSESGSNDSSESEWTKLTAATQNTKKSSSSTSWIMKRYGQNDNAFLLQTDDEKYEEPVINNVWSACDSVGAVKTDRKDEQSGNEGALLVYNAAFDYIRNATANFSNTTSDPPSDKSMFSSRSIRAEDAGSVLLRAGIIRKKNNELARLILKQKHIDLQKAGIEP